MAPDILSSDVAVSATLASLDCDDIIWTSAYSAASSGVGSVVRFSDADSDDAVGFSGVDFDDAVLLQEVKNELLLIFRFNPARFQSETF